MRYDTMPSHQKRDRVWIQIHVNSTQVSSSRLSSFLPPIEQACDGGDDHSDHPWELQLQLQLQRWMRMRMRRSREPCSIPLDGHWTSYRWRTRSRFAAEQRILRLQREREMKARGQKLWHRQWRHGGASVYVSCLDRHLVDVVSVAFACGVVVSPSPFLHRCVDSPDMFPSIHLHNP